MILSQWVRPSFCLYISFFPSSCLSLHLPVSFLFLFSRCVYFHSLCTYLPTYLLTYLPTYLYSSTLSSSDTLLLHSSLSKSLVSTSKQWHTRDRKEIICTFKKPIKLFCLVRSAKYFDNQITFLPFSGRRNLWPILLPMRANAVVIYYRCKCCCKCQLFVLDEKIKIKFLLKSPEWIKLWRGKFSVISKVRNAPYHADRVTRFVKISPLWQNFKSLWLFFEGLFCIWQTLEPNWANVFEIGQILIVVNGPILKR